MFMPTPPKSAESDTPRTDVLLETNGCGRRPEDHYGDDWSSQDILDIVSHAKQLERELSKAIYDAMTEAAEIAKTAKVHIPADPVNHSPWASSDSELIKQAILFARDKKGVNSEIPKQ